MKSDTRMPIPDEELRELGYEPELGGHREPTGGWIGPDGDVLYPREDSGQVFFDVSKIEFVDADAASTARCGERLIHFRYNGFGRSVAKEGN